LKLGCKAVIYDCKDWKAATNELVFLDILKETDRCQIERIYGKWNTLYTLYILLR